MVSRVVSSKAQLEKLVQLMEAHDDIAKGVCSKVRAAKKWAEFSSELNSLGPPSRSVDKWMKVWADYKFKIKKKNQHNKAELRATGGGPNTLQTLSSLEESVVSLLQLDTCSDPPGREYGFQDMEDRVDVSDEVASDVEVIVVDEEKTAKAMPARKKSLPLDDLLSLKREKLAYKKAKDAKKFALQEKFLTLKEKKLEVVQKQLELHQKQFELQEKQSSVTTKFFCIILFPKIFVDMNY